MQVTFALSIRDTIKVLQTMLLLQLLVGVLALDLLAAETPDVDTHEAWMKERPVVDVSQGRVVGIEVTRDNVTYNSFRGIPYARPPLGDLRFKDPEPPEPWEGELDARFPLHPCPQLTDLGREDCLQLSVYTPKDAVGSVEPLAVMVFIHGGAFHMGSEVLYEGVAPLLQHDVVVVVLQYRLGILGFMSTEDLFAPGNLGLKDQTMALRWVKDNIAEFGGNPERVTIFGESAGAASTHWQMFAPSASGLFRGAIIESGSALSSGGIGKDFLQVAQRLARKFECPESPSYELVSCLQKVDFRQLSNAYSDFEEWNGRPRYFGPRVDGIYIPDHPVTLLKKGLYTHVPIIMGTNRNEGAYYSLGMYTFPALIEELNGNFSGLGPISLNLLDEEEPLDTATRAYEFYLGGTDVNEDNADNVTKLYTDRFWAVPLDWTVQLTASQSPVFVYEFHHRGQYGLANMYFALGLDLPQAVHWVSHSDELQYLFTSVSHTIQEAEDITVRNFLTTTWTNFAKELDPTPDESLGFLWEETDAISRKHLRITPTPTMQEDQRASERAFWESLPLQIIDLINN